MYSALHNYLQPFLTWFLKFLKIQGQIDFAPNRSGPQTHILIISSFTNNNSNNKNGNYYYYYYYSPMHFN